MGVKGTFYSTWLFNTNIADQLEAVDYVATFSPSFGATAALFFTDNLAVSLDVFMPPTIKNWSRQIPV
jgi:hypothetical protein